MSFLLSMILFKSPKMILSKKKSNLIPYSDRREDLYRELWMSKGALPSDLAKQTPTQLGVIAADSGLRRFSSPAEYNAWIAAGGAV